MGMFGMLKLVIIPVSFSKSSLPSYQKKKKKNSSLSIDFVLLILLYFIDFVLLILLYIFEAFTVTKLKNITFSNSKTYFIYFNNSFYNTLNIKASTLTFNILKQYKKYNKIIYPINNRYPRPSNQNPKNSHHQPTITDPRSTITDP